MENHVKIHPIFASVSIVLLVAVMYVSLLPVKELPDIHFFQVDKLVHIIMYFVVSLSLYKGFFNSNWSKAMLIACVLSLFYGIIVEVLQYFLSTGRMFDIFDIFANGIGTIIAWFVLKKVF